VRTTLSLDDGVAHLLKKEMRRSRASLKETVNHFLRFGLMMPVKTIGPCSAKHLFDGQARRGHQCSRLTFIRSGHD
jgi:hypothetical protein